MRCISIAKAMHSRGIECKFISNCQINNLIDDDFELFQINTLKPTNKDYSEYVSFDNLKKENTWVVLDGYYFDSEYQKNIMEDGLKLMVIDDYAHLNNYYPDILLNPNLGSEKINYSLSKKTLSLRGSKYAILRDEFLSANLTHKKYDSERIKLLVTMGGVDLDNVTGKVIDAVRDNSVIELKAVVGGGNPNKNKLEHLGSGKDKIEIIYDSRSMSELMNWSDIAITGAGSTCWELAYMRVPMLTIILADNQENIAESLQKIGVSINLGRHETLKKLDISSALNELISNKDKIKLMHELCRNVVDGKGINRIISQMQG